VARKSDTGNQAKRCIVLARDVTERKQMQDQVHHLAFNDHLTKLPNRRLFDDRLSQALAASKRSGLFGALMFLDLDNFKPLNDRYGHAAGDLLLAQVARRLTGVVRETDTVARLGGDEFVVLLSELLADEDHSTGLASVVAEKVRLALAEPYQLSVTQPGDPVTAIEHCCSVSIGVVLFVNHLSSQTDLLKWADAAMYQAKDAGRNAVRFH
jgi:diguanylate cyclase (GGDEF)-like protein